MDFQIIEDLKIESIEAVNTLQGKVAKFILKV